nr:MAG TPA: hypothetical protein [Caudoviricetes sp.]
MICIGGCLSLGFIALRSGYYLCFDELGKAQPFLRFSW